MNLNNLDTNRLIIFVTFIVVFIGVEIALINNFELPTEVYAILTTLGASIAGLVTNMNKKEE